jgi:RNA polymerase sigma-70 factor (ECF subfamily)
MTTTDTGPLHALYAEHHGWLIGWLRRQLGNADQAADLAQDTFIKVMIARRADAGGADLPTQPLQQPKAYLATIARRLLIDQTRRQSLERSYLDMLALQPDMHAPSEEERAMALECLRRLDAMLQKLAAPVRAALLLSQLEGLTYEQIAEQLAVSVRTVKRYMATAFEECLCVLHEQSGTH